MGRQMIWKLGVIGLLGVSACTHVASYQAQLTAVRRPADTQRQWGEYRLERTDTGYVYNDSMIQMTIGPQAGKFYFWLENKTQHSLQVVWDDAAYVSPDGSSSKVSPGETRLIDIEKSHPATIIPAGAKVYKVAVPNNLMTQAFAGGWTTRDFVFGKDAKAFEGRELRLVLPIKIEDTVNEYTFVFQLSNVRLKLEPGVR